MSAAALARMTFALKIFEGKVTKIPFSALPDCITEWYAEPTPELVPRNLRAIADEISRLAHRMVPWVKIFLVPHARPKSGGVCGGTAFTEDSVIQISASGLYRPDALCNQPTLIHATAIERAVETLFHECWHVCSTKLSPSLYKACADVVKGGMQLGDPAYYDTIEERLARLFSHWAMAHWQGWQSVEDDPRTHQTPSSIFAGIYSGYFAQVLAAQEKAA